ncbi:hypothetical protein WMF18_31725 [Sorangium sp. So ce315]|uniref:hypothetical protein n=1 Tax=Sorangium sp. So ce315 TaxID=3133299 RepID=UPI003F5ED889
MFDSKLTTYKNLSRLDAQGIIFVTLRRRTDVLKRHVLNAPAAAWRRVELDVPHRKSRNHRGLDETIRLGKDYRPLSVAFVLTILLL